MHQAARLYDAAIPEQPVSIDDVVLLDVMNMSASETTQLAGHRLLSRYHLNQPRLFTCRVDDKATTVVEATLFDERHTKVASIDIGGKPTQSQSSGAYTLDVISNAP